MGSSVSGAASASSAAAVTAVARLASLFYHDQNSCFCAVTLWSLQYAACFLSSLSQLEEAEPGSEASRSIVGTLRSSCVRSWRAGEDEVDDVRIMGNFPVREALARHRGSRGEKGRGGRGAPLYRGPCALRHASARGSTGGSGRTTPRTTCGARASSCTSSGCGTTSRRTTPISSSTPS